MIVYNYDADLEVSDTCVRSSLLSWVELRAKYCDKHVCVCSVCLSAVISSEVHVRASLNFLSMLPMGAVARSSSGGGMICISGFTGDVIFAITWGCSTSPPGWGSESRTRTRTRTRTQAWAWRVWIPVPGSGRSGLFFAVRACRRQWACWIFMTSCHCVYNDKKMTCA